MGDDDFSPAVTAYRLGELEKVTKGIDEKLDLFSNKFVTKEYLDLTLEPLRESVKTSNMRRWALFTAILSPVVVALLLSVLGAFPGRV